MKVLEQEVLYKGETAVINSFLKKIKENNQISFF